VKMNKRKKIDYLDEISTFCKVSSTVTSTLELEEVLDLITRSACQVVKTHACTLRFINEERDELDIASSVYGLSLEYRKKGPVKIKDSIAEQVIKGKKPQAVLDVLKDPRYKHPNFAKKAHLKSLLSVPLIAKNKVLGVLNVYSTRLRHFSKRDEKILMLFASEAAIAIENAKLVRKLQDAYLNTLKVLGAIVDAFDWHTERHSEKVRDYALAIAKKMNLPQKDLKDIEYAAYIHDIGKVGVDLSIIRKPEKLSEEEWRQIIKHPLVGANIAERMDMIRPLSPLIMHHHERYDGKGYPNGLKSESIPLGSRILAVADTYEAMTAERPYRKAFSKEIAIREIKKYSGVQFDPKVVGAFLEVVDEFA